MFIVIDKKDDKYIILDSISGKRNKVKSNDIVSAIKLGIEIDGVSLVDNKLRVMTLDNKVIKSRMLGNGVVIFERKDTNLSAREKIKSFRGDNLVVYNFSKIDDMYCMFEKCSITKLDLSKFNTSMVSNMSRMFSDCKIDSLSLDSFDTSNVTNMRNMFYNCEITSLDLSNFDTSKVTNMMGMFWCCKTNYLDLSSFKMSKKVEAYSMFMKCSIDKIILKKSQRKLTSLIGDESIIEWR